MGRSAQSVEKKERVFGAYHRVRRDISWNLLSFAFQAVAGVGINVFLGRIYGAEGVGVFNQCLAVIFLGSQLGSWGMHYSVLRFVAEFPENHRKISSIALTALGLTAFISAAVCAALTWVRPWLAGYFQSDAMMEALGWTIPAIWFFCLNKVLLGLINGLQRMRTLAILQASRYLFWMGAAVALALTGASIRRVPALLLAGEALLCFSCVATLALSVAWKRPESVLSWSRRHLDFGSRSFLSGSLIEANSRVDILVLGHFFADKIVGIYSMATLLFEGLSQLGVVLRNQWNPELTRLILKKERTALQQSIEKGFHVSSKILWPSCLAACAGYPLFIYIAGMPPEFADAWLPFSVLCLTLALVSGFQPFTFILMQGNYPGRQTVYLGICAGLNLVLNVLLVPHLQMLGASAATATSLLLSAFYLRWQVRRLWDVRLAG